MAEKTPQVQSWYEFIRSLSPSKMAIFFRKKLAHNQGCPPAPLMWVFTACYEHGSCDECWWAWLESERGEKPLDAMVDARVCVCWHCRWGARIAQGGHPLVLCMHKDMKQAIMQPDAFCSNSDPKYWEHPQDQHDEPLTEETAKMIGEDLKRNYELKQLEREIERRRQEKQDAAGGEPDG